MGKRYRIIAAVLAVCICGELAFPERIMAQEPENVALQDTEEAEDGIVIQEDEGAAPEEESANAIPEDGSAAPEEESANTDPGDDDPGRGRLDGEIPAEFYGSANARSGIMTMAASGYGSVHDARFNGYTILKGIDVSKWNGSAGGHPNINWSKVKSSGIDFVFVRAGYRGTSGKGTLAADPDRDYNLRNAAAAGLHVGAYIFSQAITEKEAVDEANYLLSLVDGYTIDMPLVFDYEYFSGGRFSSASNPNLSDRKRTDICLAFCETVAAAGYTPMVYANLSMLRDDLKADEISEKYPVWLARYNTEAGYSGAYSFWQYSSSGKVSGIEGNVDMNYWYVQPGGAMSFGSVSASQASAPGSTSLSGSAPSFDTVNLSWSKVSGADGYLVYRYDDASGAYKKAATIKKPGTVSWTDESRNANTVYRYMVRAYREVSGSKLKGANSNEVSVKTQGSQTGKTNGTSVAVRSGPGTSKSKIKTLGINVGVTLTGSSGNWYRVSVKVNGKKKVGYISKDYITIIRKPTLKAAAKSKSKIKLTWDRISGANGYEIQRYEKKKWKTVKTITKGSTVSWKNSGLKKNKTYKYRIRSYKKVRGKKIYSNYTSTVKVKTKKK